MSHLFQVIPEPRCLNNVKAGLDKGRYKEATDVYTDISLVFWNALYYNEPGSGIATDAETLKVLLFCWCFVTEALMPYIDPARN